MGRYESIVSRSIRGVALIQHAFVDCHSLTGLVAHVASNYQRVIGPKHRLNALRTISKLSGKTTDKLVVMHPLADRVNSDTQACLLEHDIQHEEHKPLTACMKSLLYVQCLIAASSKAALIQLAATAYKVRYCLCKACKYADRLTSAFMVDNTLTAWSHWPILP